MHNNTWSTKIQGIKNLELSRELRFRDDRKELFLSLLDLRPGMTVLDVGCGPGAITRKLATWLGEESTIIGVDRDSEFIKYAEEKARDLNLKNVTYFGCDAFKLPLEDNSVDACISHTVIEHVPHKEFLLEQKRVCRPKGRVSVMYQRPDKSIKTQPSDLPPISKRELELMEQLFELSDKKLDEYNVGKYWPDPVELPKLFEKLGFTSIQVDSIAMPIVIDDARHSTEDKVKIISSNKEQLLESIDMASHDASGKLQANELRELKGLINERIKQRIELAKRGTALWDYNILLLQIVSGQVE